MLSFNALVLVCLLYVVILFGVAFAVERLARRSRAEWLRSPLIYTLSLSVYCTAWTFYGAVGYAARSGLEFVTIYLGPTLVMLAWWGLVRKLVRIGKSQRITSVADLISARYGKSATLGAGVTCLAVLGTAPYIALQLQSVTLSFAVFQADAPGAADLNTKSFLVAAGLALFAILFGTRRVDVNERHLGVVMAIAVEAVVKLVALLAVGIFVVFSVAGGPAGMAEMIDASEIARWQVAPDRWAVLIFLAGAAFLCLPRMFHVMVVENTDESHVSFASWAFPLYLMLISLFVVPIAVVGLSALPEGTNPDMFVLTVPLFYGENGLATLAFLGGFSSATSMVIVASIAVSTMVSNNIVMPIWLNSRQGGATVSGDVRDVALLSRRVAIIAVLALGLLYYRLSGGGAALAAIGLISFTGVAQVLPAMIGGIFWRGATRAGAAAGILTGAAVWLWTSFLPSFGDAGILSAEVFAEGPFGIGLLRPEALFGLEGLDPLVHAVFWSMLLNTLAFVVGSLVTFPSPLERLQAAAVVDVFRYAETTRGWSGSAAEAEDLMLMSQRILGPREAQRLFEAEAAQQGKGGTLPDVTPGFLERLEKELSGSVGAATAHAMLAQITGGTSVSVADLLKVADEAQQILEYSGELEQKSEELATTARQLREANAKLVTLSVQKDGFLSQISHELRTPMTSIRAFSEILMAADEMATEDRQRMSGIIHEEAIRLTRLLDDLLDLSVLENGEVTLNPRPDRLDAILDRAIRATDAQAPIEIVRTPSDERIDLQTDSDRLVQVFINLVANARKYCTADAPRLAIIVTRLSDARIAVDFVDNGTGLGQREQDLIFEKFARLGDSRKAGGAGLGLAISREIMSRLGGEITYLAGQGGAAFRVILPVAAPVADAAE